MVKWSEQGKVLFLHYTHHTLSCRIEQGDKGVGTRH